MNNLKITICHTDKDQNKYYDLIYWSKEDRFFLQNEEGEGTGMKPQHLFNIFDKYFKDHF